MEQIYYIGDKGPFFYDDEQLIDDPESSEVENFPGETLQALRTTGRIATDYEPQEDNDLIRKIDLENYLSAEELLARLLTVDGEGSELDADFLDGHDSTWYLTEETLLETLKRHDGVGSGLNADLLDGFQEADFVRKTNLLIEILTVDGHLSGIDADLLDGQHASEFATTAALNALDARVTTNTNKINLYGSSVSRPASPQVGQSYFDSSLNKPIWYNGAGWVDATGTSV